MKGKFPNKIREISIYQPYSACRASRGARSLPGAAEKGKKNAKKRIVDVDFSSVIRKEVTETMINKVEDITAKNSGYFSSLFNFGNVHVQTAGAIETIEFLNVPRPTDVFKVINSIM